MLSDRGKHEVGYEGDWMEGVLLSYFGFPKGEEWL
jgi:hypothetical protein